MIEILLLYLIIGFIHMFIINLVVMRINKLGEDVQYNHVERISTILIWPIFAFFFWYNFFRALFGNK